MVLSSLGSAILCLALAVQALSAPASNESFTFRIPPQRISLKIENQPLTVAASGIISVGARSHDKYILKLKLDADLTDLQQNITKLLSAQLDKDDPCGDHITIEHATLAPVGPSVRSIVQLHYERYTCVKAFGTRMTKRLVGGHGIIQMKFTPAIENRKTLQLRPEVESIQADGALGELLRSGQIGAMVREKISKALLSALQKGTDRSLTLPPAVQDIAMIDKAQFEGEGSGRLAIVLGGEVLISRQQTQLLKDKLKERMPAR